MMHAYTNQMHARDISLVEDFMRSAGATESNAHLYTQIILPGDKPLSMGGTFRLRSPDNHIHMLRVVGE